MYTIPPLPPSVRPYVLVLEDQRVIRSPRGGHLGSYSKIDSQVAIRVQVKPSMEGKLKFLFPAISDYRMNGAVGLP